METNTPDFFVAESTDSNFTRHELLGAVSFHKFVINLKF